MTHCKYCANFFKIVYCLINLFHNYLNCYINYICFQPQWIFFLRQLYQKLGKPLVPDSASRLLLFLY